MEVFTVLGSVAYIHFCYRAYLKNHWRISRQPGLRGMLLSLDHISRAYLLEPVVYRFASKLIVPSRGLARELTRAYPFTKSKIHLLPNSADFGRLSNIPVNFDREGFRTGLGFSSSDVVLIFIALGQFERKGFPQLLDAIARVENPHLKLMVVGGSSHWIEQYGLRAESLGIRPQIVFAGMQRDVAPFLWAADVFTLPSFYEISPLVVLEAAAAGCALLVTHLNGVEDYIEDGISGIYVQPTPESIADAIRRLAALGFEGRAKLGMAARRAASGYSTQAFVENWDAFLTEQLGSGNGQAAYNEKAEYVRP
jgi:glycosyltransferase involved in cell wall biosynthesis